MLCSWRRSMAAPCLGLLPPGVPRASTRQPICRKYPGITATPGAGWRGACRGVQIALSLVLVSATCLFAFSLQQLRSFDSGCAANACCLWTWTRTTALQNASLVALNERVRDRLAPSGVRT